jgi:hypothetical protein
MTIPACANCRSANKRKADPTTGQCLNTQGCEARRCQRRKDEDDKRRKGPDGKSLRQCFGTMGHRSIRFCTLREGHEGLHLNGATEWGGRDSHPLAQLIRAKTAPTENP